MRWCEARRPGGNPQTQTVGSMLEGGQCRVSNTPSLEFYAPYIPAANQTIEVTYRGRGHAMARVMNSASIAALRNGDDDGVRAAMRGVGDAGAANVGGLRDRSAGAAGRCGAGLERRVSRRGASCCRGKRRTSFRGMGWRLNVPSRGAAFLGIVREVDVALIDMGGENLHYTMKFVDAGDPSLGFAFAKALVKEATLPTAIEVSQVGSTYLADLTGAEVTDVTSTTVTVDAGWTPPAGWGIEVRESDEGWGTGNAGNLIGRYTGEISPCRDMREGRITFCGVTTIVRRRGIRGIRRRCTWTIRWTIRRASR